MSTKQLTWHHTGLTVSDLDASIAFYSAAFGFAVVFEDRHLADPIARLVGELGTSCAIAQLRSSSADASLELLQFRKLRATGPQAVTESGAGHISFHVAHFEEVLARLIELGACQLGEVITLPPPEGQSVYLREPGGSYVELEEIGADPALRGRDTTPRPQEQL